VLPFTRRSPRCTKRKPASRCQMPHPRVLYREAGSRRLNRSCNRSQTRDAKFPDCGCGGECVEMQSACWRTGELPLLSGGCGRGWMLRRWVWTSSCQCGEREDGWSGEWHLPCDPPTPSQQPLVAVRKVRYRFSHLYHRALIAFLPPRVWTRDGSGYPLYTTGDPGVTKV